MYSTLAQNQDTVYGYYSISNDSKIMVIVIAVMEIDFS